jgi:hypothetical protein
MKVSCEKVHVIPLDPEPYTVNSQTLNPLPGPEPQSLHPKPLPLNPEPYTLQPYNLYHEP